MEFFKTQSNSKFFQYSISLSMIAASCIACYYSVDVIGYQVVALILLLVVSVLAMLFDILPVLVTAFLSALSWNFFFIPPTFTFHIGTTEDALIFFMYFVIALINAVLTFKIRDVEKKAREKEEREKSLKLYNTMLNSLSHELKTPISTIIGAIDTIKENASKLSEFNKSELYTEIEIAGFRLNRQVENLLSMSRLEAGVLKPKMDWCDINELIFSVIKDHKEDARDHQICFEPFENLPLIKIDRGLTEQIIHNILLNAIQHTAPGTIIEIRAQHQNGVFRLVLSDNGKGFPEQEIQSVFRKFYRLPNSTTGGTGLGLSIAKGFAEALNGSIHLENLPTGGAKFTIDIPSQASSISDIENE
ncbi:ATP-binding protein [Litoribacter ruber]|uniref:ATP-binding protein n=1 Tax=Litoribacter ruber TaxID=702568 RepID=UPI001FE813C5|nr:ATP-binding protein [Litoribacter ruber]